MGESNNHDLNAVVRDAQLFPVYWKGVVEVIASSISLEEYQRIIKTLEGKPSVAKKLYLMQKSYIINEVHQDIEYMWQMSKLDEKYNEITKLINHNKINTKEIAWRPATGDCEMQLLAHRLKNLQEKRKKLGEIVTNVHQIRMSLKNHLQQKRNSIEKQFEQLSENRMRLEEKKKFYEDQIKCHLQTKQNIAL